jgi:hypothetical protein
MPKRITTTVGVPLVLGAVLLLVPLGQSRGCNPWSVTPSVGIIGIGTQTVKGKKLFSPTEQRKTVKEEKTFVPDP